MAEPMKLPMLPMRDIVVFPHMTTPFFIGRKQSMEALENALAANRQVFVVAQRDPMIEKPTQQDLFEIGTIGNILQIMRLPNGTVKALFEAKARGRLIQANFDESAYTADVEPVDDASVSDAEMLALAKTALTELEGYLKEIKRNSETVEQLGLANEKAYQLADRIAPLLNLDLAKKQELLETLDPKVRLQKVFERMIEEAEIKKLEKKLKERVQGQIGRTQKEYYLNEQIKAIQKELGTGEDGKAEAEEYEKRITDTKLSPEAAEVAKKELKKLKMMSTMSAEANVVRNYLDTLLGMPWGVKTEDNFDLKRAEQILNEDHYGLDRVKERIVEYLAVAKKVGKIKGPIICLVGPPGVGKTSLARSVARALGRKFVRMSLGGIRDEAEIRGHRRTYIGALPGKIIQSLRKAKSNNPLMLLDEVDKMTYGAMGDPAAALLEVLDAEQNHTFMDHYLEVEYDLSDVLFFCTANNAQGVPPALRDRMELISLSGYTELEKEHIATRHLIDKQREENGLKHEQVKFRRDALIDVITRYTREAGVRSLEREIGKICRKVATQLVKNPAQKGVTITPKRVQEFLGVPKFKHDTAEGHNEVGVATGMAWTAMGGELLFIEASLMHGKGALQITGRLGDVMKESVQAALSFVRSNANRLGIYSEVFRKYDLHIHFPEGAIAKDGPSAGIPITAALVSAFTEIPVRKQVAMTGEITLRGRVLQIGGLKEKLLAAKRGLITEALIPDDNQKDLTEVPIEIKKGIKITPVKTLFEALEIALERMPAPVQDPLAAEEHSGELDEKIIQPGPGAEPAKPQVYTLH
ncbi:MAG: endopeptidase La [Candidatus Lambdaproteobacteria bacterium]|nr:endopeptidase La [Candidatus Lambdaproteobacteria bacterium]